VAVALAGGTAAAFGVVHAGVVVGSVVFLDMSCTDTVVPTTINPDQQTTIAPAAAAETTTAGTTHYSLCPSF
jgi:hypothetical protein